MKSQYDLELIQNKVNKFPGVTGTAIIVGPALHVWHESELMPETKDAIVSLVGESQLIFEGEKRK